MRSSFEARVTLNLGHGISVADILAIVSSNNSRVTSLRYIGTYIHFIPPLIRQHVQAYILTIRALRQCEWESSEKRSTFYPRPYARSYRWTIMNLASVFRGCGFGTTSNTVSHSTYYLQILPPAHQLTKGGSRTNYKHMAAETFHMYQKDLIYLHVQQQVAQTFRFSSTQPYSREIWSRYQTPQSWGCLRLIDRCRVLPKSHS
ncbi:hypothetical protein F4806DRAFT_429489 [Annulohypoxylon nitens]|nr:hypothetical protein F4806DRAFT_429489 [Annulohypoxylon nitens]